MPRVIAVDPKRPDPSVVAEAAAAMRAGKLVAFPTETVYGLGARGLDADAVRRIFEAKGRPPTHPLILHVAGEAEALRVARAWPPLASELARTFWPGPLTIVVPRGAVVPEVVSGGGATVALRAPSHPVARALLAAIAEPVAAPSANRYQTISPTTARHVVKSLGDGVDLVLDAGACPGGIESTVVDVTSAPLRVLRPGGVTISALRAVAPDVVLAASVAADDDPRASPGMGDKHYAPRAPLTLERTRADATAAAIAHARGGGRAGLVLRGGGAFAHEGILCRVLPIDAEGYARLLFATMHDLEDAGATAIVVESVPDDDAWQAIADRLCRARGRQNQRS
jgi:L-threonylcarbamoyladenylate synthase